MQLQIPPLTSSNWLCPGSNLDEPVFNYVHAHVTSNPIVLIWHNKLDQEMKDYTTNNGTMKVYCM